MSDRKSCWECLKRRLVCDFTRPRCTKCSARGVSCPGYDHKPLKWIVPGQTRSKRRGVRKDRLTSDQRRRQEEEEHEEGHIEGQLVVVPPSIDLSSEITSLFDAIQYYNEHICPDMLATGVTGSHNPFFTPLSTVGDLPDSIKEALISSALGHRILQSSSERPGDETAVLATRLQTHRGAAIRTLADALSQPKTQTSDAMIVSIFVFLLAEIQQSISTNWRHHLDGAAAIIQERGGLSNLVMSRPLFRNLLQYFILIDVLGSTTAPEVGTDSARRTLELVPLLPLLFGDGLQTCIPCPSELVRSIIRINAQRNRLQQHGADALGPGGPGTDRLSAGLELLQQIRQFSPQSWAAEIKLSALQGASRRQANKFVAAQGLDRPSPKGTASWDWQRVAAVYQAAVALYCISSLLGTEVARGMRPSANTTTYSDTCGGVNAMRVEYCSSLLRDLRAIAGDDVNPQLRKMVIWPLVMAGIEVDPMDEASQRFIEGELGWMSRTLGIASPLIGRQFLGRLWAFPVSWHQKSDQSWEGLFDRPYIFAL
ncbi:hypothetical protein JDV02_003424 [Purpureocillium takamizusanense]|uniref:Zn(2)-C6 fungal-type domain-containing protein n=1 Tax=Purpureocillium takamizusanense TaxID=2060973 RepID=A0A9Q8V9T1_9HYPO|nr:uncharacterized protein JDV02_003424 [Purpureocillium takamizusanense]UNI17046.1 hypothetical protein JDV02_003424 [Purpureocillium takamizusanense]